MREIDFLSRVPMFSLMKKEDLERLTDLAERHDFQPGAVIIREGDPDKRLFVILTGEVEVIKNLGTKREISLGTFGPFRYFGEMALIDDLLRSASVVARKDTRLLSLGQDSLRQEIMRYPTVAFELLQVLSRRIRAIEKTLINTLGTFLPICANCKRIRDRDGVWIPVDDYISDRTETEFSHSICPDCSRVLYPGLKPTGQDLETDS